MFHLTKAAGLEDALYRGQIVDGKREGIGTQIFPNGYVYVGGWKNNLAQGQGKLRYTDGCFYEGEFDKNRIKQGMVRFPNGTIYQGTFQNDEKVKERFLEGTVTFCNGDSLKGVWVGGNLKSGTFMTRDGKPFDVQQSSIFVSIDQEDPTRGKHILVGSSEIYEGGLEKNAYNGKGFLFSSYPHYERFENKKGKLDGKYSCNYISGGYCYEGFYKNDERIGEWTYTTVKGYQYTGEPSWSSGMVTFPFLSKDYFKGKTEIRFHNITLVNGVFNYTDEKDQFKQKKIENVKGLSEIEEIRWRRLDFDSVMKKLETAAGREEPVLNGLHKYTFEDGSSFTGNFNLDFIFIHKKDLPKCYTPAKGAARPAARKWELQSCGGVLCQKSSQFAKFEGTIERGQAQGVVRIEYLDGSVFEGEMRQGKRQGPGRLTHNNRVFEGTFVDDELQGEVLVKNGKQTVIATFNKGRIDESRARVESSNGLKYCGPIKNFNAHGHGELSFDNGFKFEGEFVNGLIESHAPATEGVLTDPQGKTYKCEVSSLEAKGLALFHCHNENDVYVFNQLSGSLKKTQ